MTQVACLVTIDDNGTVGITMPTKQDPVIYATIGAMVLSEVLDKGASMEMILAGVELIKEHGKDQLEIVPEPLVIG